METKCQEKQLNLVKTRLGFQNAFVINLLGRRGRIALFWKDEANLEVLNYFNYHIHVKCHETQLNF